MTQQKKEGRGVNHSASNLKAEAHNVNYGMKLTPQIEQQLPILIEYIRITPNVHFIPKEIASASTILYAVQEGIINKQDRFSLVNTPASLTAIGSNSHSRQEDCTVDPETLCCTVCGVDHSEECLGCGKRGYHASTCPQMTSIA